MTIWFTSDTHFYHYNIIKYCNRPWETVAEMNEALVNNINFYVHPNDRLYHLGDFLPFPLERSNYIEEVRKCRDKINCHNICYIYGNHEPLFNDLLDSKLFSWVKQYYELKHNKQRFVLFHYPIESWNWKNHGSIHLHGHIHSNNPITGYNRIDIGVDAHIYDPVHIDTVLDLANISRDIIFKERTNNGKNKYQ